MLDVSDEVGSVGKGAEETWYLGQISACMVRRGREEYQYTNGTCLSLAETLPLP